MARLAIRQLRYNGKQYEYKSPKLRDGLNIIEGPNGTGKSTFTELIYFGLGGNVDMFRKDQDNRHMEIASDNANRVELDVEINGNNFVLWRDFRLNDIVVVPESGSGATYPINRRPDAKAIFSDWLLNELDIKPVEMSTGDYSWQLNARDLFRLIYHDQALDPKEIYRSPDTAAFLDRKAIRKAIFQILVGKNYQKYYSLLGQTKEAESEKDRLKGAVDLYGSMTAELRVGKDDLNIEYLAQQLAEKKEQLDRLENYRSGLNETMPKGSTVIPRIDYLKSELVSVELKKSQLQSSMNEMLTELASVNRLRSESILEVTQISKMIFAHETLGLFTPDTCPYCLREIEREKGKCVCGAKIEEEQYEKFFYSSDEYMAILKAKQKSVETIDLAISSMSQRHDSLKVEYEAQQERTTTLRTELLSLISDIDRQFNLEKVRDVNARISDVMAEIQQIERQIELEEKRQELENRLTAAEREFKSLQRSLMASEIESQEDIQDQISLFNDTYQELMMAAVKDVRRAEINDDFVPILDGGQYREASSGVAKRLMYFLTLLSLSLKSEDVKYPRFLLIDTPETAGIDPSNLIKAMEQMRGIVTDENLSQKCQIIMTTGIGKYPPDFQQFVVQTLSKDSMLLRQKA